MTSYCGAHASPQKITETTESLKICYILNIIRTPLRSYVNKLKWRINSEWTALRCVLLNVLFVSCVNVHHLHLCWRRKFWAHVVIKTRAVTVDALINALMH